MVTTILIGLLAAAAIIGAMGIWTYIKRLKSIQALEIGLQQQTDILDQKLLELASTREALAHADRTNSEFRGKLQVIEGSSEKQILEKDKELTNQRIRVVELEKKVTAFEESRDTHDFEHRKAVSELSSIKQHIQEERTKELEIRQFKEDQRRATEKETWKCHEAKVEENLKAICRYRDVEYVEKGKFPDTKKPDNSILVCDEFVIFDAKSPRGEDLSGFNKYVQAEVVAAKKYAKKKFVKNDIYLVVPTKAIHVIDKKSHDMGDYRVFIVDEDSLESIVCTLKRLEDYEFADKLAPEDREQLANLLGKFRHASKRRIQVDQVFAKAMMGLIEQSEELPDGWSADVKKMEKSAGLTLPRAQAGKELKLEELLKENRRIVKKAELAEVYAI